MTMENDEEDAEGSGDKMNDEEGVIGTFIKIIKLLDII